MLYEIDAFGYTWGYIKENWSIMSKDDLMQDTKLKREFHEVQYKDWKRHNLSPLYAKWNKEKTKQDFDAYCRELYSENVEKWY